MALVEVDVVGAQALQGSVDLLVDLCRREASVGVGHLEVDLRREHVGGAVIARQHLAEQRLGRAPSVDVGGVDEVDALLEGCLDARLGLLALHSAGVGQPGAEADLRDIDAAGAKLAIVHAGHSTHCARSVSPPRVFAPTIVGRRATRRPCREGSTVAGPRQSSVWAARRRACPPPSRRPPAHPPASGASAPGSRLTRAALSALASPPSVGARKRSSGCQLRARSR